MITLLDSTVSDLLWGSDLADMMTDGGRCFCSVLLLPFGLRTSVTQPTGQDEWLFALNLLTFASCCSKFKQTTIPTLSTIDGFTNRAVTEPCEE